MGGSDSVRLCPGGGGGGLFLDRVELPLLGLCKAGVEEVGVEEVGFDREGADGKTKIPTCNDTVMKNDKKRKKTKGKNLSSGIES